MCRVVTKISSCRVNTTSRREFKQLGISFGSIFLLFSNKSSHGATIITAGGNLWRPALNDNPAHVTEKLHQQKFLHPSKTWSSTLVSSKFCQKLNKLCCNFEKSLNIFVFVWNTCVNKHDWRYLVFISATLIQKCGA